MMNDLSIAQPARERGTGILSATVRIRPVANLFSAKGALSSLAWGNLPRHSVTSATSAKGAIQLEGEDRACCRE